MSNNDSIKRGDTVKAVVSTIEKYFGTSSMIGVVNAVKHCLAELSPAPKEMSAREYEKVKDRMRRSNGTDNAYGLYVRALFEGRIDDAVAIVEKWAREHPEEVNNEID